MKHSYNVWLILCIRNLKESKYFHQHLLNSSLNNVPNTKGPLNFSETGILVV